MQTFLKSEADRTASTNANATQMLLALELANLKRAIDRGERYAEELAPRQEARRLHAELHGPRALHAGGRAGTAGAGQVLPQGRQRHAGRRGRAARRHAVDRLLSGARSIVRVRKAGHAADDASLEAIIGRMEAALKEGRLADVLANAKKLPPKAALAGEDWVKKVEARQAVEQAHGRGRGASSRHRSARPRPRPSRAPEGKR